MRTMKHTKIFSILFVMGLLLFATSCDRFLDEMPDNRTEIDTQDKVLKLLISAYPENSYLLLTELSSDNIDDFPKNPNFNRFYEEVFYWKDVTQTSNESPARVWSALYSAIGSANVALAAIEKMGTPKELLGAKGEALICRAYAHFMLVNIFSKHYNKNTSSKDLGVTYMSVPETELNPKYKRESVAEIYGKIEKDLKEGLPLISDGTYKVPKYHFNVKAAYAFASRFYLFYEKWDEAIKAADVVLTSQPSTMLRDNKALGSIARDFKVWSLNYASENNKCNLLLMTAYSNAGLVFGPYYDGARFAHSSYLSNTETFRAKGPWGNFSTSTFWARPWGYLGTNFNKDLFAKVPYLSEVTDAVAQIGYNRTVYVAFTAEEALLNRAEAYVMKKDYDKATEDLATWSRNMINTTPAPGVDLAITRDKVNSFYGGLAYYTPTAPTIKKKINPSFTVEAGEQENFVQCVLHLRRISTLHEGLRWFDVKRYGIEISRRQIDNNGGLTEVDKLPVNDERRAIQIPKDVIDAGYTPNPR